VTRVTGCRESQLEDGALSTSTALANRRSCARIRGRRRSDCGILQHGCRDSENRDERGRRYGREWKVEELSGTSNNSPEYARAHEMNTHRHAEGAPPAGGKTSPLRSSKYARVPLTPAAAPFIDSIVFTCAAYTITEQTHTSVIARSFGRACSAKTAPTARCLTRS